MSMLNNMLLQVGPDGILNAVDPGFPRFYGQ